GKVGGPWGVLGWTWPKVHGPFSTGYDITLDGLNTRMSCGDMVQFAGGPIRNPVTGVEAHPAVELPAGIIFKRGHLRASATFRVTRGITYDHSGKYIAIGPFDYRSA